MVCSYTVPHMIGCEETAELLVYFAVLSENELKCKFEQLQSLFEEQLANTENVPQVTCSQYVFTQESQT